MILDTAEIARKDALPEGLDTRAPCGHRSSCGCEGVSNCCFKCPLEHCRFDEVNKGRGKEIHLLARNTEIIELCCQGEDMSSVAEQFKLHRKTVSKIFRKYKNKKNDK